MQQENLSSSGRSAFIDALRGISIILVVLHHTNLHMAFEHLSFARMLPRPLARMLFWNGANGVLIFLAISGFLITSMSLRRWGSLERLRLRDFYRLRLARIAPLLLSVVAVLALLHLAHLRGFTIKPEQTSLGRAILAALTFHVNYLEAAHGYLPANWDVMWSLSVEEAFYLGFPVLCLCTRRLRYLLPILLAVVVLGPVARTHYGEGLWAEYGYPCRMDAIAFGCLAALALPLVASRPRLRVSLALLGSALALFVTAAMRTWNMSSTLPYLYRWQLDDSALPLGVSLLLLAASAPHGPRNIWSSIASHLSAPLRWFGRNSYEVYLTHMFVVTWGIQLFVARGWGLGWSPLAYLVMLALSGILGALVARGFSERLNRHLRRRWGLEGL